MRSGIGDEHDRSGWMLVLIVATGLALGAWLAVWVAGGALRTPLRGEPSSWGGGAFEEGGETGFAMLQVVQAGTPAPALSLPLPGYRAHGAGYPRILLVALPTFGARQRAFLFIRPADPGLCRSLHGVELAVHWNGPEPTAVCAVGDPPSGDPLPADLRFRPRRSS